MCYGVGHLSRSFKTIYLGCLGCSKERSGYSRIAKGAHTFLEVLATLRAALPELPLHPLRGLDPARLNAWRDLIARGPQFERRPELQSIFNYAPYLAPAALGQSEALVTQSARICSDSSS